MKKILFIGIMLSIPFLTFSQSENKPPIDERLYEVFDAEFLERLQVKSPSQLQYYNFFLDNIYEIKELPQGKTSDYPQITISDIENINILKLVNDLQLKRDYNNPTVYLIANTNKILVLISEKEFVKEFNKHTGRS